MVFPLQLLLLPLFFCAVSPAFGINPDGKTLLSLSKNLILPPSVNSTWISSSPTPCNWTGIQCDNKSRVAILDLYNMGVSGQLGPEIGQLSRLIAIVLGSNNISGVIPATIGNLTRLQQFDISYNSFYGNIPESIGQLNQLSILFLFNNFLHGGIPESIFNMPALVYVALNDNNLTGSIPANVGNLSHVKELWLSSNLLTGEIPYSIGNCTELIKLFLGNNKFTGVYPGSLANSKDLKDLDVSNNSLEGTIPPWLGSLKNLSILYLSSNQFEGEIPMELGNCSHLQDFEASLNKLSGQIPPSLGALVELSYLYLTTNNLSGTIPPEIGNCSSLTALILDTNQLEGSIPPEVGMLSNLKILDLYHNNLSGEVPFSLWRIPALASVHLYGNNLFGELPSEMAELKNLQEVSLFSNQLSGVIPPRLGVNSGLQLVDFKDNKFTGGIPPFLCFRRQLSVLILGGNQLQGSIPSDVIKNCPSLRRVRLGGNNLTGPLPDFPKNSSLNFIELSENGLDGSIPQSLGNCISLGTLIMSHNRLTGAIPQEIGNLANLQILDLSYNSLNGQLPSEISRCSKLYFLDLGFNQLNGSISSLGSLTSLQNLILQENLFTGGIPDSLSHLKNLLELRLGRNLLGRSIPLALGDIRSLTYALDLSGNGLEGGISPLGNLVNLHSLNVSLNNLTGSLSELGSLHSLVEVNISYNNFTGPIPQELLKLPNVSQSDFVGNPGLCIACNVGDGNCATEYNFSPCNESSTEKKHLNRIQITLIVIGLFVVFIVSFFLLRVICLKRRKNVRETVMPLLLKWVMDATENLNDKYIIGRGGYGTVYKAKLDATTTYAVKRFSFSEKKGVVMSMKRETEIVASIKHRNLVRLVDFWLRKDHGLILYEYLPNGSLHDVLHEIKPQPVLPWDVRYKIAIGTAQGLSYLHNDCNPPIVHRDIKSTNILLDSEMEPHICDFGIAKIIDQSPYPGPHSHGVIGTFGYMPPEYAFSTRRTKESDVYSYGVVLLELLTRKQALDPSFEQNMDLVRWVKFILRGTSDVRSIADQGLLDEATTSSLVLEEAKKLLFVALRCTAKEVINRPSIREVVNWLMDAKAES